EYVDSFLGQALMLTFAATAAGLGLIAIWAAVGRTHWLLRALAVWGSVMLLVPIRVYQGAAIFAVACPLIVVAIAGAQWLSQRRRRPSAGHSIQTRWTAPTLGPHDMWAAGIATALSIVACEAIFQGRWW